MSISPEAQDQLRNAGIFLIFAVGFLGWQIYHDPTVREQNPANGGEESLIDPSLMANRSGDESGATGENERNIDGHRLTCLAYNNPDNYWGPGYPRDTYDPSLPTARTGEEILNLIGEPGIDLGPYYIVINDEIVDVRMALTTPDWKMDANGKEVCVGVGE